ncbi:MAG: hypothetical protein AB1898_20120 [Acidobacteriota bacterium]
MVRIRLIVTMSLSLTTVYCNSNPNATSGSPTPGSSPVGQATAAKAIDPCSLLTSEEIENILGWKVANADAKTYGTTGNCTYTSANPYAGKIMEQVTTLIGQGMPAMSSSNAMAQWRLKQYEGKSYQDIEKTVEPVEGLGVPAIRNEVAGLIAVEMAVEGRLISVSTFGSMDAARALAAKVLTRAK